MKQRGTGQPTFQEDDWLSNGAQQALNDKDRWQKGSPHRSPVTLQEAVHHHALHLCGMQAPSSRELI